MGLKKRRKEESRINCNPIWGRRRHEEKKKGEAASGGRGLTFLGNS